MTRRAGDLLRFSELEVWLPQGDERADAGGRPIRTGVHRGAASPDRGTPWAPHLRYVGTGFLRSAIAPMTPSAIIASPRVKWRTLSAALTGRRSMALFEPTTKDIKDPDFNYRQFYDVTVVKGGVRSVLGNHLPVPPHNIGSSPFPWEGSTSTPSPSICPSAS